MASEASNPTQPAGRPASLGGGGSGGGGSGAAHPRASALPVPTTRRSSRAPAAAAAAAAGGARGQVQQRQVCQPAHRPLHSELERVPPPARGGAPGALPARAAAAAAGPGRPVTPVRNSPANKGAACAAQGQGRNIAGGTTTTTTTATTIIPTNTATAADTTTTTSTLATATTAGATPGRPVVTSGRRISNGASGRGPANAGFGWKTSSAAARNAATPDRGTAGFGANAASAERHNAASPDLATAPLSRATPLQASATSATRIGLVASPYQRRTSYGNPGVAPRSDVARRLNLNPTPLCRLEAESPCAAGSSEDSIPTAAARHSPYVRRNAQGGSRIAIDRVLPAENTPQAPSQAPTQQSSGRRLSALESFRNSRRTSATFNSASKESPLPDVSAAVQPDREPTEETLFGRMDAAQGQTHRPQESTAFSWRSDISADSTSMPDRQEDSLRHRSGPGSPAAAKIRKISDLFAEGSISAERVDRMSLSLSRRRSRGQSGGPSDFPEETPTLTVAVQPQLV